MPYRAQPSGGHETVNFNCTANPLDCLPISCPGGDECDDFAAPPPPPLPRAPTPVDHQLPVRLLLTVSLLSAFLFLSLALSGGGGDVHHVWYIRTVGLDEATIASIATKEYRRGVVGWGGDCAVCLGEFDDGELVRLLPRCAHPFHAPCIDTWLRAHVNCPLCRSPVVVPSAAVADAGTEGGEAEEHQVFELSPSESLAEGSEDSDASSETQSEDTEASVEENGSGPAKPIRRSASMDSPLFLVVVPEVRDAAVLANRKLPNGRNMKIFRAKEKEAAGTSSSSCQAGGFRIGRSMSSSGRTFFFSRNGHSSGAVLPL